MIEDSAVYRGVESQYDKDVSILHYIKRQADESLHNVAVIDAKSSLTYQVLFESAKHIASQLKDLGLKRGENVFILSDPCSELIILIIAILMNGANYTAVDRSYPAERIANFLGCNKTTILVQVNVKLPPINIPDRLLVIDVVDLKFLSSAETQKEPFSLSAKGSDAAYIIYTSGTTGSPKGIVISHQAVNNHMLWMKKEFGLTSEDRFLLKTPLAFDPSVWEIFLPLYLGATLVIAEAGAHANPFLLSDYVQKYKISVLQLVPAVFRQFLSLPKNQCLEYLRFVFVGGESLSKKSKILFFKKFKKCRLVNLYGPAEATIDTTFHEVLKNKEHFNKDYIGKPIYNVSIFVLDAKKQLCKKEEIGELYLSGDALALGYLSANSNLKSFIENPFSQLDSRLYKTGDLVRLSKENVLEYIGRKDDQLKINGVRIEKEEIKREILNCKNVLDCVIDFKIDRKTDRKFLISYLLSEKGKKVDTNEIKSHLKCKFPAYMIPHQYYVLDDFFITSNGKIDFEKIRKYVKKRAKVKWDEKITNESLIKKELIDIWEGALNRVVNKEDENTNFYDLGGDSISAFVMLSKINEKFSINMMPEQLIFYPTISLQEKYILNQKVSKRLNACEKTILSLNSSNEVAAFLVHPIGGTVFWYLHLAKFLDKKIQIYGIQDPGIAAGKKLFSSISDMANYYTEHILSQAPMKKYILGGASFGATLAVEIAKNLIKHGCEIESVLILDGWAIYPKELKEKNYFFDSMLRQQSDWALKFNQRNFDSSNFDSLFRVQTHRLKMLFNHEMQPFDFHIDIFKARNLMPVFERFNEPFNYWDKFTDNLNLYHVPGTHETMFQQSNVANLGRKIIKAISNISSQVNSPKLASSKKILIENFSIL